MNHAKQTIQRDVIVVGAGISGLVAARELVRQGVSVQVLEARDRVGGRTFDYQSADGYVVTLGAGWLGPDEVQLRTLLAELDLPMIPQYSAGQTLLRLRGQLFAFEAASSFINLGDTNIFPPDVAAEGRQTLAFLETLCDQVPLDAPHQAPRAAEWDAMTVADWLDQMGSTALTRAYFALVIMNVWGIEPEKLSFLYFLFAYRALCSRLVDDLRIQGGSQQICLRLSEQLPGKVECSAPVRVVSQNHWGVTVQSKIGVFQGQYLIVAVSPVLMGQIVYNPPLPVAHNQLAQGMLRTASIKCVAVYERPFWRELGLSGILYNDEGPLLYAADNSPDDGSVGIMVGFILGDQAKVWGQRSQTERRARVLQQLTDFLGAQAAKPRDYVDQDWYSEPWSHTYIAVMPPKLLTTVGNAIRESVGRIHWAGTERSIEWPGSMEGAILSGQRAAMEILEKINHQ